MDIENQDVNPGASSPPEPTSTPDVTPPSSSAPDVSAPSSGADAPAEKKEDLLSVVMDALKPKDPEPEPEPKAADAPAGDAGENQEPEPDLADVPDDELAKYTPAAQKRIRGLANQNRELRKQLELVQPDIVEQQKLRQFMEENHLQNEHVGSLLQFGAALRQGDLEKAKRIMEPYWVAVNQGLGEILPDDIKRQVDEGLVDESVARELARTQAENQRLRNTLGETSRERDERVQAEARMTIAQATTDWETEVRAKDPDYSAKADTVREFAKAIIAERGLPRTPQEARAWSQEALDKVNKTFARFRPAPEPTRRSPTGVQVSTPVAPEPKSLAEAIQMGLQKARTGS